MLVEIKASKCYLITSFIVSLHVYDCDLTSNTFVCTYMFKRNLTIEINKAKKPYQKIRL